MKYLEYIKAHESEIKKPKAYRLIDVYSRRIRDLESLADNNPDFGLVFRDFPHSKSLYRQDIFESYKNDNLYKGFVYTMLWGGLGLTDWNHLELVVSQSKAGIEEKLNRVYSLLSEGNYQEAFNSMLGKEARNKINGVGPSYFTKIMYFMFSGNNNPRPLIYDKWGKYIHAALLIDANIDPEDYYRMGYDNNGFYVIERTRNGRSLYDIYYDYLTRMQKLSDQYKLDNAGVMEEFLFGKPLRSRENKDVSNNPRAFVKQYVIRYYYNRVQNCINVSQSMNIETADNHIGENQKRDLLKCLSCQYGDELPGTPRDGHFEVKKTIRLSENKIIKLSGSIRLRINHLRNAHVAKVSLVFNKNKLSIEELDSLFQYYCEQGTNNCPEKDLSNDKEYRIYWSFPDSNIDDAIGWIRSTIVEALDLLPEKYYKLVER